MTLLTPFAINSAVELNEAKLYIPLLSLSESIMLNLLSAKSEISAKPLIIFL